MMSNTHRTADIQGRLLGIPYDWRRPTWAKLKARVWNPGGPLLSPKVFGWGWTINLAHRHTKVLFGVVIGIALAAVIFGG